jgi:hypothetical protein
MVCSLSWTLDSRERFIIIVQVDGKKQGGRGDSLASHQTLAAHLLACPHPAVYTHHLCNTSLGGWRVDGEASVSPSSSSVYSSVKTAALGT